MEIKIDREIFLKSISRFQSIIEKRSNMPILSTILLTATDSVVRISATDLEIGFQQILEAEVIGEGSITVSGRKLFEILKESRAKIFHIKEKENNWVFLSDDVAQFNLSCLPADEYPTFVEPKDVNMVEIEGDILSEMINKTIYAVTMEDAGFKLSGIFTEKTEFEGNSFLRMVATDGHRLSLIDKTFSNIDKLELGSGVVIPKKGMSEINKLASDGGTVMLGFKDKNCVVKKDNTLLIIRLLETKFPDYHAVIPKDSKFKIDIDRGLINDAMRKMLILSNERYRAVKIILDKDLMELFSTNPDLGEAHESIQVKYNYERMETGFNPRYFIDTLQAMESDMISLSFLDGLKPCVIRGEVDEGFVGLMMPMRL